MKVIGSIFFALCLLLGGCEMAATQTWGAWETVTDEVEETAAYDDGKYEISLGIPEDAELCTSSSDGRRKRYSHTDGDYEITTEVLLASSMESMVRQLTGLEASDLDIIKTTRFDLPEYRFVWYRTGENGGALCRADVVADACDYYAVVFAVPEDAGKLYYEVANEVFSTFGLFWDEGV